MRPFLIASPILFMTGIAFVYFVVMPMAFTFLIGYALNGGEFNMSRSRLSFRRCWNLPPPRRPFWAWTLPRPGESLRCRRSLPPALRDMAQLRPLDKVSIDPQTKIADYLRDSMRMLIGAAGFQLPVALTMVRSGLVSTKFLKRNRKLPS